MTQNQIAYQNLLETGRSNRAREALTAEQNAEQKRSNLARESNLDRQLSETIRANQAREYENHRTNVANENLRAVEAQLTNRRDTWAMLDNAEDRRINEEHYIRQDENAARETTRKFLDDTTSANTQRYTANLSASTQRDLAWVQLGGNLGNAAVRSLGSIVSKGGKK